MLSYDWRTQFRSFQKVTQRGTFKIHCKGAKETSLTVCLKRISSLSIILHHISILYCNLHLSLFAIFNPQGTENGESYSPMLPKRWHPTRSCSKAAAAAAAATSSTRGSQSGHNFDMVHNLLMDYYNETAGIETALELDYVDSITNSVLDDNDHNNNNYNNNHNSNTNNMNGIIAGAARSKVSRSSDILSGLNGGAGRLTMAISLYSLIVLSINLLSSWPILKL